MTEKKSHLHLTRFANIVIPFVAGGVFATLFQEAIQQWAVKWESLFLMVISFCLVLLSGVVYLLSQDTGELVKRVGVKVSYLEREHHSANLFKRAKEIVERAEHSILVLNSPVEGSEEVEKDFEARQQRRLYYEALLDQVAKGKGKIKYERLLQIHDGQDLKSGTVNEEYGTHLHRMLDEKEKNPNLPMRLMKVRAKHLATFVLIDGKYLILESNEFVDSKKMRMHGFFIIEDPHGEITTHFTNFFEDARFDPIGPVNRSDLAPRASLLQLSEPVAQESVAVTQPTQSSSA